MDQVTIKAEISAHGLRRGQTVTVAETPIIAGAIRNGVFKLIDRIPEKIPEPVGGHPKIEDDVDDSAPNKVEDVDLTADAADAINESADGNQLEDELIAPSDDDTASAPTVKPQPRTRRK